MVEPDGAAVVIAYLGAGAFYVAHELISAEWSKQRPPPFTVLAMVFGAAAWGPACLIATLRYAHAGWRHALVYFASDVVPPLMIMIGGLAAAIIGSG
jgi:hypothetical protein